MAFKKSRNSKVFLALIQKKRDNHILSNIPGTNVCYDVTITTGLLSRLHLQKQAVRLKITSIARSYDAYLNKSVLEQ
jgi:hypothetical protein